jgi:hypothetical protein
MKELKIISVDVLHETIHKFIIDTKTIIGDYEDIKSLILLMIKAGYMFNMDRDRLRDAMEDLTFMLCPDDDANRDRVERGLEYDSDDSEDSCDYDNSDNELYATGDNVNDRNDEDDNTNCSDGIEEIGNVSDLK